MRLVNMILRSFFAVLILITGVYITAAYPEVLQEQKDGQFKEEQKLEERWGIKILSMRLTAGGYMLDFRYKVTDAEKATPLFTRKIKPYLIDQASGAKFKVPESPKIGALRQTRSPIADRNYFIIFANPGQYVKKGNKVTVVIGDFRAENIIVN